LCAIATSLMMPLPTGPSRRITRIPLTIPRSISQYDDPNMITAALTAPWRRAGSRWLRGGASSANRVLQTVMRCPHLPVGCGRGGYAPPRVSAAVLRRHWVSDQVMSERARSVDRRLPGSVVGGPVNALDVEVPEQHVPSAFGVRRAAMPATVPVEQDVCPYRIA
jgi:hypothetical protein